MSSSLLETEDISDPYVEHLRQKYLIKEKSSTTSAVTSNGVSDSESFIIAPANASLTESERKHYNRAMAELRQALKIGEKEIRNSAAEYEKVLKSTSSEKSNPTSEDQQVGCDSPTETTPEGSSTNSDGHTFTQSVALPTVPSSASSETVNNCFEAEVTGMGAMDYRSTIKGNHFPTYSALKTLSGISSIDPISLRNGSLCSADIKAIYAELAGIYSKLQEEKSKIAERQQIADEIEGNFNARDTELVVREAELLEKERDLLQREQELFAAEQNVKRTEDIAGRLGLVEVEVQSKLDRIEHHHNQQLKQINVELQEKSREVKRLKSSFETVKNQNEELRNELSKVTDENGKIKAQNTKMRKRLENLQRRQDYKASKPTLEMASYQAPQKAGKENSLIYNKQQIFDKSGKWANMFEALAVVLEWISDSHLKHIDKSQVPDGVFSNEYTTDKCLKVLPLLVDIIRLLPQFQQSKFQLPYLSFIYWSLTHLDDSQHTLLSSTTRRLGEELYKPVIPQCGPKATGSNLLLATTTEYPPSSCLQSLSQSTGSQESKTHANMYFRSSTPEVRLVSAFIILKTLHQVDVLAHVFGQLKRDLKEEITREIFVAYKATHICLPYLTYKANRALMGNSVDVLLQMSMESALLPSFLDQCSTELWFRSISSVIRPPTSSHSKIPSLDVPTMEKMSIILQKLSKLKCNRRYFEAFSLGRNLQEWYRICDPQNTFLSLNLRSILFNLNLIKEKSEISN